MKISPMYQIYTILYHREEKYFYNYELMLDKFLTNVCDKNLISQEKCILKPIRYNQASDSLQRRQERNNSYQGR